jgi:4-amino-4-deoxy-L-arabinose transferase-like glycosyltransferase
MSSFLQPSSWELSGNSALGGDRLRGRQSVRSLRGLWTPRALGLLAIRRYALCAALVLGLMAWNVFVGLGSVALNDSDEARYGVSAWEMARSHSYIVTTYAGQREYWNLKPPLGYWLMALAFRLFGPTPFALRLPSALCALGVVAGTLGLARRWLGRRESLLAALILATAFGFLSNHGARSGDLDAALTLLLLFAMAEVARLGESPWRAVSLAAILSAGFLLKSFAILPILGVAGIYLVATGAWRRQRPLQLLLAFLVFTLPIAAWAWARVQADGSTYFLRRMIREDLLERSTQVIDKVTYSPLGYVAALFDRFAPWPLLLLVAALVAVRHDGFRSAVRKLAARPVPLLLLWAFVPLVLFSLSRTQHHWYLDPSYPAWAMLAALALLGLVRRVRPERRAAVLFACVLLPLALCEVRVLYRVLVAERMPEPQRFLARLGEHRLELGPEIRTSPLRHSERFILEAMDGFVVLEVEEGRAKAAAASSISSWTGTPASVLVAKEARGPRPQPPLGSGIFLDSRDYLLFQGTNQLAGRSAPPGHRRRIPLRRPDPGHLPPAWRPRNRITPA